MLWLVLLLVLMSVSVLSNLLLYVHILCSVKVDEWQSFGKSCFLWLTILETS